MNDSASPVLRGRRFVTDTPDSPFEQRDSFRKKQAFPR